MAEAIGLAASVAGLVALGLSVCKGLAAYYDTYQSAENDVKLLCEEVNNLTLILQVKPVQAWVINLVLIGRRALKMP
jgi:hypothetical protein